MTLANKLTSERRARLAAERLLELKQSELFAANRKLGQHAQQLTEEIVETRAEVETIRGENRRVKSDLSAAHQRIAITERRLWHSIQTINDGFALFDGSNNLIMANRSYLSVFDKLEEIRPGVNYVTILQALTEEGIVNTGEMSSASWRQMMVERIQQRQPDPISIQLWNGNHVRLMDQRGPDGDMVSLGLDITATVKYEQQLKEARAIAESANRAKSAFLANMSHEIRTPMNGVVGMADVLVETELSDEQRLYVDTIRNSGEALLVIINDVLDYSKIEAKKLDLHPQPFDLERAIQEVLMLLHPNARAKGLSLVLDYDLFLPTQLVGDPGRLRQVLTNLLGNAVKFTSEGHVMVRVTGVADDAKQTAKLHIAIEDTGIGIPEDMVDHIFGEFNQVQNERNRQFDGTGLGLAISQRLIEMMEGQIWVTSEEGVGSCFGFTVDLGIAAEGVPDDTLDLSQLGPILVVSEVLATRNVLARQLGRMGGKVTACATGDEVIQAATPHTSLIIIDHQMEETDGLTCAHKLKESGVQTPILMLSTSPGEAEKHEYRSSIDALLQFPPPRRDLMEQLRILTGVDDDDAPKEDRLMRILAAEDNKTNQLVFSKMIKDLNVDLRFAKNGQEAVLLYQECLPDVIFMDISMPIMDGKEATQAIRKLEEASGVHVPIVALTAHAMGGDGVDIMSAGLDHYLTKPLRKPEILAQITEAHGEGMLPLLPDQVDG